MYQIWVWIDVQQHHNYQQQQTVVKREYLGQSKHRRDQGEQTRMRANKTSLEAVPEKQKITEVNDNDSVLDKDLWQSEDKSMTDDQEMFNGSDKQQQLV